MLTFAVPTGLRLILHNFTILLTHIYMRGDYLDIQHPNSFLQEQRTFRFPQHVFLQEHDNNTIFQWQIIVVFFQRQDYCWKFFWILFNERGKIMNLEKIFEKNLLNNMYFEKNH